MLVLYNYTIFEPYFTLKKPIILIMKTFKLFALLLCLSAFSFVNKSNAQIDVTINPIGLLFGDLNVGADFVLSENLSIEGTIGIATGSDDAAFNDAESKYFGLPITVFGKYYFNPNNGADKFYIDAWLRFVSRSYNWEGNDADLFVDYSQTRVGGGFGIGYKVVSDGGFVFDIGFGAGRAFIDNTSFEDGSGDQFTVDWPDIMFAGKLGVGYRFGGK